MFASVFFSKRKHMKRFYIIYQANQKVCHLVFWTGHNGFSALRFFIHSFFFFVFIYVCVMDYIN